jgi:hypothetical protein
MRNCIKKFPLLLKEGWSGSIDYLIYTVFSFPTGVVDLFFSFNRSTSAEVVLWEILKSKNLDGRKFRRRYSIDSYIVDFCCPSEKLINT